MVVEVSGIRDFNFSCAFGSAIMKAAIIGSYFLLMTTAVHGQQMTQQNIPTGTPNDPVQIQQGSKPTPDPTELTNRAIVALRAELKELWDQKFLDLTKQLDRLREVADLQAGNTRTEMANLDRLMNEKFKGLSDQQVQRDNNLALALTAQQKSVADQNASNTIAATKAETSFKDQIAATQATITDLKDRITRIESGSAGSGSAINWVIAAVGFLATLIAIGSAIYAMTKTPAPLPVVNFAPEPISKRRA